MGRFKNAMKAVGEVAVAMSEHEAKVNQLTNEIMDKTYGIDAATARQFAKQLVNRAEITWKY